MVSNPQKCIYRIDTLINAENVTFYYKNFFKQYNEK